MGLKRVVTIIGIAALVQFVHSASIGESTEVECMCTREYHPICGTDGITYGNECLFNCEKRLNFSLNIKFYGNCDDAECVCTQEYSPVCGSDDRTYANDCLLNCERSHRNDLIIKYYGECVDEIHVPEERDDDCVCTQEYFAVCGSDDQTYDNECKLNCEKFKNNELTLKYIGECRSEHQIPVRTDKSTKISFESDECVCSKMYMPVCGSNGKTYLNECVFNCAQERTLGLTIKHFGICNYPYCCL